MPKPVSPLHGFSVAISFTKGRAVIGIRGEVDLATAPEFGAVLDGLIDRGHRQLLLDLAHLDFMDASGLAIIARGINRLGQFDGGITIRSAPALVLRILEITGLARRVDIEGPPTVATRVADDRLGPEQRAVSPVDLIPHGPARSGSYPRQLTAIPVNTDVVDGVLRLVVALTRATIGGADGVSVSLHRHGRLTTVAASDQTISEMDASQYATSQGPCVDAAALGRWFHSKSLADERRWPAFIPEARKLGINAILSSPLMVQERPVGALNIYSRATAAFAAKDQEIAAVFAEEVSVILRNTGAGLSEDA